jgi:hypothetical protein
MYQPTIDYLGSFRRPKELLQKAAPSSESLHVPFLMGNRLAYILPGNKQLKQPALHWTFQTPRYSIHEQNEISQTATALLRY